METFFTECPETFDFFLYIAILFEVCSKEQGGRFFFSGLLFPSFLLKWCCDVVCHLIGFIHFIFCASVYSVFSLLLSLYSSSSFFFISASAAVFKLHLLLRGRAERNLSFYYSFFTLCPNAAALWQVCQIGGKGQLESQFLTTPLKIVGFQLKPKLNITRI